MPEPELVFLGTGGGRFSMVTQRRWTGGIRLLTEEVDLHLDPGPGALIRSIWGGLKPWRINVIAVSHAHPDHCNDAEILIEAMTNGGTKKRGTLLASRGVLRGNKVCEKAISNYHQSMPKVVVEIRPGEGIKVGDIGITATKALHADPDTVGFKFKLSEYGEVAYTSDTEYFEGISELYAGVRLLILCALRPRGAPWKLHMSTDDALKIIEEARPETAILTHFGQKMLTAGPEQEAKYIEKQTGIRTVAALDGMKVSIGETIAISLIRGKARR